MKTWNPNSKGCPSSPRYIKYLHARALTASVLYLLLKLPFSAMTRNNKWFIYLCYLLHIVASPSSEVEWDGVMVRQLDLQTVLALKEELVDPLGFLRSWNDSGTEPCSGAWKGVRCSLGQVIAIHLPWKGFSGRITSNIGNLKMLRKLSLHDNTIGGPIPATLGLIPNLRALHLHNNAFTGSIPPSLANCRFLQNIFLANNALVGVLPDTIATSYSLLRFNASFNRLTGTIPANLLASSSLVILALHANQLSGSLNFSLTKSSNLQVLDVGCNKLGGTIPDQLGNVSKLTILDFSSNNFNGGIPSLFSNLNSLKYFNVSYNNLSGSVPSFLANNFSGSSFLGNSKLCYYPGGSSCNSSDPSNTHRKLGVREITLIASGGFAIVLILSCFLLFSRLSKKKLATKVDKDKETPQKTESEELGGKLVHIDGPLVYTADDLLSATAEMIGKGTLGNVYKATLRDGNKVVVKRLREKMTKNQSEFEEEVISLAKIRHPNLLSVRAYYVGLKGEKFLILDYISRGSLAAFLHCREMEASVDWMTRMNIMKGVTRGLMHLHDYEGVTHGNLTSRNVLVDDERNPKIADYGMGRLMKAAANSDVAVNGGGLGYRAPELWKVKKANNKTDVYSLGVIMLELLTGKAANEATDLPQTVSSIVKEHRTSEVFDEKLMIESPLHRDELLKTLKLALQCVDQMATSRPEAQQILDELQLIQGN